MEREASPTACIIDSQSVKAPKKGGVYRSSRVRCGQANQGQETAYSRRHARSVAACDRSFCWRSGSRRRHLLATLFGQFPFLTKLFADSAYAGPIFDTALDKVLPNLKTEIVRRSDRAKGFVPLPKRWIVERTIAWLNRCRRLAKDWENLNRSALAFLKLASIRLMLRKRPLP